MHSCTPMWLKVFCVIKQPEKENVNNSLASHPESPVVEWIFPDPLEKMLCHAHILLPEDDAI